MLDQVVGEPFFTMARSVLLNGGVALLGPFSSREWLLSDHFRDQIRAGRGSDERVKRL